MHTQTDRNGREVPPTPPPVSNDVGRGKFGVFWVAVVWGVVGGGWVWGVRWLRTFAGWVLGVRGVDVLVVFWIVFGWVA